MRRIVKYRFMTKMSDYTSGQHRLPSEYLSFHINEKSLKGGDRHQGANELKRFIPSHFLIIERTLIPVQWTSWLSHTRQDPPSISELQTDAQRQSGLIDRIAEIDVREREERYRQGYISSPDITSDEKHSGLSYALPAGRVRSGPSLSPRYPPSTASSSIQPPVENVKSIEGVNARSMDEISDRVGDKEYAVPTPSSPGVPPPPETVDPSSNSSKDTLRKLAEEDTKRRIAEAGGDVSSGDKGVQGVQLGTSGGFKPRRRG